MVKNQKRTQKFKQNVVSDFSLAENRKRDTDNFIKPFATQIGTHKKKVRRIEVKTPKMINTNNTKVKLINNISFAVELNKIEKCSLRFILVEFPK